MLRALLMTLMLVSSATAQAFCGFYVSGADAALYNDATLVVLMRQGQRTVLSMQNSYQGPPEDFAMVVPVPQMLPPASCSRPLVASGGCWKPRKLPHLPRLTMLCLHHTYTAGRWKGPRTST